MPSAFNKITSRSTIDNAKNAIIQNMSTLDDAQNAVYAGGVIKQFNKIAEHADLTSLMGNIAKATTINNRATNLKTIEGELNALESSLQTIIAGLDNSMGWLIAAATPGSELDIKRQITIELETFELQLNQKYNNTFLFGGSTTSNTPVSDLATISNIISGTATSNYYHGNQTNRIYNLNDITQVKIDISASDPMFQNVVKAYNITKDEAQFALDNSLAIDTEKLLEARNLIFSAQQDITNYLSVIGNNLALVSKQQDQDSNDLMTLENSIKDAMVVDPLENLLAFTRTAQLLQASIQITNKILSDSIQVASYIK